MSVLSLSALGDWQSGKGENTSEDEVQRSLLSVSNFREIILRDHRVENINMIAISTYNNTSVENHSDTFTFH